MARDDITVLMASNAALNRRDVDGMLANYATDAVVADHRQVAFGTFRGHDELRTLYSGIGELASEFREDVRVLQTVPGTIVAHCEVTARLASDPHGSDIGAEYGFVVTIENELITRLELFDDGEGALEASGISTSPEL